MRTENLQKIKKKDGENKMTQFMTIGTENAFMTIAQRDNSINVSVTNEETHETTSESFDKQTFVEMIQKHM